MGRGLGGDLGWKSPWSEANPGAKEGGSGQVGPEERGWSPGLQPGPAKEAAQASGGGGEGEGEGEESGAGVQVGSCSCGGAGRGGGGCE